MFERFCPNIHGICRDGYPNHDNHICIYWDSLNEECSLAKSILLAVDGHKLASQLMFKRLQDEERLEGKIKATKEPEEES